MVLLRVKPDEVGHPLGQRSATFNIKRATLAPPTKQREKKPHRQVMGWENVWISNRIKLLVLYKEEEFYSGQGHFEWKVSDILSC